MSSSKSRARRRARAAAYRSQLEQKKWQKQWEDYQRRVAEEGGEMMGLAEKFGRERSDLGRWLGGGLFKSRFGGSDVTDRFAKETRTPLEHLKMRDIGKVVMPGAEPEVSRGVNLSGMLRGSVDRPDLEQKIYSQEMGRLGQLAEGERWWESREKPGHELSERQREMDITERKARVWTYQAARQREKYAKYKAMGKSMMGGIANSLFGAAGGPVGGAISAIWEGFNALRRSEEWQTKVVGGRKKWGRSMMAAPYSSRSAIGGLADLLEYSDIRGGY